MTIEVQLPVLHAGQVEMFWMHRRNTLLAVRCGRRWGKTDAAKTIAADTAIKGQPVGWFAPDYKIQSEAYAEIADVLEPVKKSSSETKGVYRTKTGGRIDFWTLENERAGRSRKYKLVIVNEGAFTKPNMMTIWDQSIKPTLLDLQGSAIVLSNTNGIDSENFLWRICNQPEHGFVEYHATTMDNPLIPLRRPGESDVDHQARRALAFEKLKADNHPLVYQQEFLAEFVDWSGIAFFALKNMLVADPDGGPDQAVGYPTICDTVFATIDTATKTGNERDGTAVCFWSLSPHHGHPLILLDWDLVQIEGNLLEAWLPTVFARLEELARLCHARYGSAGAHIEDAASGMILLQQARARDWPAEAINSKLTSVGKSERAISVSGYVYRGMVKLHQEAYDKQIIYKGVSRNHMLAQVTGFRIGQKDKVDDDLLDCWTYGIAIGLGDSRGF